MSERIYHRAHLTSSKGDVSPLCADRPRKINVKGGSGETWTLRDEAVTCPQCIERIRARTLASSGGGT